MTVQLPALHPFPRRTRRRFPNGVFTYLVFPLVVAGIAGCDEGPPRDELVFLDGRAVSFAGDSVLAITQSTIPGVLLRNRARNTVDTLGAAELESPLHVQWFDDRWYVSDVRDGRAEIVVFSSDGALQRRIPVDTLASAPHQFAVLPDGRIVVEALDGRLVAFDDDSARTFALTQTSSRTGLLVAARGGVVHAVHDRTITLYNAVGNIRWRLDWPWEPSAFVVDLAVDSHSRPHVIAGQEGRTGFVVFSLSPETGEIGRWSMEGPFATFIVRPLGEIRPDSAARWIGN